MKRKKGEEQESGKGAGLGGLVEILLCIILIPVIVINTMIIVNNYKNPDKMPGAFGYMPAIVLSGSMSPLFEAGSLIIIKEVEDPTALNEGDVICYLQDGKAITHRIISREKDGERVRYITKGDANNVEDFIAVQPEYIQGLYTGLKFDGVGDIAMFLQSTTGMMVFVICPMMAMIAWDLLARGRENKKDSNRTKELEEELARLKEKAGE